MNDYQRYYVYMHVDPRNDRIRYIGMGSEGRAWQVKKTSQRSEEHYAWIQEIMQAGHTLDEVVYICAKNLTKAEALAEEAKLITENKGCALFNLQGTGKYLGKVPTDVSNFAKALHQMGYGYQHTAFLLGAANPKTKVMSAKRMINIAS